MNLVQATYARHAVRHFDGKPLKSADKKELLSFIKKVNKESGLNIQLITNEPKAFGGAKAKICNFTGCVNYLAIVGPKGKENKQKGGYYGEKVVLKAQQMGLNTCWVVLTFNKIKGTYSLRKGEKLFCVIALGYGTTQGKPHKSKQFYQVVKNRGKLPQWFIRGVKMALLAPTGRNQQGFMFELLYGNDIKLKNRSLCKDLDLGIIKYHFEIGAGDAKYTWNKINRG